MSELAWFPAEEDAFTALGSEFDYELEYLPEQVALWRLTQYSGETALKIMFCVGSFEQAREFAQQVEDASVEAGKRAKRRLAKKAAAGYRKFRQKLGL